MAVQLTLAKWFKEHPEIEAEWDSEANTHINPETDGYATNKKAWWKCPQGHRYEVWVYSRTISGQNCPYCKGTRVLAGYNDLATTNPNILIYWDYEKNKDLTPTEVSEFSHKRTWWKCEKGHSWNARIQAFISSNSKGYSGCPYCSGAKVVKGENDLLTLRPEIAKQWCYELNDCGPEEVGIGKNQKVWWKCELGHTWKSEVYARARSTTTACPYCTNYKVWTGFNDLATFAPEIAKEWNYEKNGDLKPENVSKAARRKVWWKCSQGHEWEALIYARTKQGTNCPYCSRSKKVNRDH